MNVERWEIWLANLEPVLGSEQGRIRKDLQNNILDALKFKLDIG